VKKNNGIRLVMFDMDGTLLKQITILIYGEKLGITKKLYALMDIPMKSYQRSIRIAEYLKGQSKDQLLAWFRAIPLQDHIQEILKELKQRNIFTAIVTNSYTFLGKDLQHRLGIDFLYANNLIIKNNIVTGEYHPYNRVLQERFPGCKIHPICKQHIVDELSNRLGIQRNQVMAVGDGNIDICMLQHAGIGIAFRASSDVCKQADVCIQDMREILKYL
jgi:phosphoserine phosphatase